MSLKQPLRIAFFVLLYCGIFPSSFAQEDNSPETSEVSFRALLLEKGEHREMVVPGQFVIVRTDLPKTGPIRGYITAITETGLVVKDREVALEMVKRITVKNFQQQRKGIFLSLGAMILPLAAGGAIELAGDDWARNNPVSVNRIGNTVATVATAGFVAGVAVIASSQRIHRGKKWKMKILEVTPEVVE